MVLPVVVYIVLSGVMIMLVESVVPVVAPSGVSSSAHLSVDNVSFSLETSLTSSSAGEKLWELDFTITMV